MAKTIFELVGRILIDNAEALEDIAYTTEQAEILGKVLEGTGDSADNTGKKLGSSGKFGSATVWLGNMFTRVTDFAGRHLSNAFKAGFSYNSLLETYGTSFKVLIGDEERAIKLLEDLWELAADTPMEMTGLAKNAEQLLNYGFAAEEVIPILNMLGDAALGNQGKMDGITYALGQIKAYGGLRGQETMQLIENGFPILEFLAKSMQYPQDKLQTLWDYGEVPYGVVPEITTSDLLAWREDGLISYEDVLGAFRYATTDDRYAGAMGEYLTTYEGQKAKLSDTYAQSIGKFMEPFYELAKSDVLPKISEILEKFGTWASENQPTIEKIAETFGNFASISFDAVLDAFKWMTENGEAVATAFTVIGAGMAYAAITAHPFAAAVLAVAGAIAYLNSESGQKRATFDHMFDGFTQENIDTLNRYVDAMNALREAQDVSRDDYDYARLLQAEAAYDAALAEVLAVDGLYEAYNTWHQGQAGYAGANGMALKVPVVVDENSESGIQSELDGMTLETIVKLYGDTSALFDLPTLTAYANILPMGAPAVDGSHANGLDYVPHDGYIAKLHQGESVLTKQEASVWRNGTGGGFDVEALAGRFASIVTAALSGKPIVLESGAVVGQLLPAIDTGLGTTSIRKGRRN